MKRKLTIYVVLALIVAISGWMVWRHETQPRVVDLCVIHNLPADATYRAFHWLNPVSGVSIRFHVLSFSAEAVQADFWFHPAETMTEQSKSIEEIADEQGAVFAINGGYFESDFSPSGLAVDDRVHLSTMSEQIALSGIVWRGSTLHLDPKDQPQAAMVDAIQAGPFLIDPGGLPGIHASDHRSQRRSVIALSGGGDIVLITADAITLHELSHLLHDKPELFGVDSIERAINLDGGPSSALYIECLSPKTVVTANGPVQNFLLFYER